MDQSRFNIFEAVRFLPDVPDVINRDVTTLKQTNRLFIALISICICAFRFRVERVLANGFAERFHARRKPRRRPRRIRGLTTSRR